MKKIPVDSYTRTCGYYAVFTNVNKGKQEEIKERKLAHISQMTLDKQTKKESLAQTASLK